jgi:opacity protein-like surface antigen
MRKVVLVFAVALLTMPARGFAQTKPVEVNFGGGVSFPTGNIADDFDTGWNGAFGVTFNVAPAVGIQAEYLYQRFGGPDRTFPNLAPEPRVDDTILIESNHQMHAGTFNLVVRSTGHGAVGGYFLVGPGIYHRIVQLTTPSVGFTTICDPYWLVCYPAAVSTDTIVGDRSSNDFGVNFGGGVTFGTSAKFYVEARYHYVWGPKITAGGTEYSSNAQYFPITFGVRF